MNESLSLPDREPVALIGAGLTALQAVLGCAVAFGLPLTGEQQAGILASTGGLAVFTVGLIMWVRSKSTPAKAVVEQRSLENPDVVIAGQGHDQLSPAEPIRDYGKGV